MPRRSRYAHGGIACPACGGLGTQVTNSRPAPGRIWRRRKCDACRTVFTTYERLATEADEAEARGEVAKTSFPRLRVRKD